MCLCFCVAHLLADRLLLYSGTACQDEDNLFVLFSGNLPIAARVYVQFRKSGSTVLASDHFSSALAA